MRSTKFILLKTLDKMRENIWNNKMILSKFSDFSEEEIMIIHYLGYYTNNFNIGDSTLTEIIEETKEDILQGNKGLFDKRTYPIIEDIEGITGYLFELIDELIPELEDDFSEDDEMENMKEIINFIEDIYNRLYKIK